MPETATEQKAAIRKLIFVYAADSGKLNALMESAKKLLSINGCSLCAITHGLAGEKGEWKQCSEEFGVPIDYLHRDEVPPSLARIIEGRLPCVLAQTDDETRVLLAPDVLERAKGSVADLKGRLITYASMYQLQFP
jgi:hypothetical protein